MLPPSPPLYGGMYGGLDGVLYGDFYGVLVGLKRFHIPQPIITERHTYPVGESSEEAGKVEQGKEEVVRGEALLYIYISKSLA